MPDRSFWDDSVLSEEANRGWTTQLEYYEYGQLKTFTVDRVARLKVSNPRFGELIYGKSPAGNYDGWHFAENGGGGSSVVPYAVNPATSQLYVGTVFQPRPLQDERELVQGFPRGFKSQGETHEEAAARELQEETGDVSNPVVVKLAGQGGNPNNTFFNSLPGGIQVFAAQIPWAQLKPNPNGEGFVYNKDEITPEQKLEGIEACIFYEFDLKRIAALGDFLTLAAALRFLAFRLD